MMQWIRLGYFKGGSLVIDIISLKIYYLWNMWTSIHLEKSPGIGFVVWNVNKQENNPILIIQVILVQAGSTSLYKNNLNYEDRVRFLTAF